MGPKRRPFQAEPLAPLFKAKAFAGGGRGRRGGEGTSGRGFSSEAGQLPSSLTCAVAPAPQAAQKAQELLQRHPPEGSLIVDTVSTESLSVSIGVGGVLTGR